MYNTTKAICNPRLIFNEADKDTDHAYNVQLWYSYDGGKSFYYAGCGRFFKDFYEAEAWRKQHETPEKLVNDAEKERC